MANTAKATLKSRLRQSHANYMDDLCDSIVSLSDDQTISGTTTHSGALDCTGPLRYVEKISLLTDKGGAGAIRSALTMADSGTHFIVPPLTTGTQTIALPTNAAANVGFTCRFTMLGTAAQIFSVDTAATADKIALIEPDGDGTHTIGTFNKARFTADALLGCSFRVTCISATDATAFAVNDIQSGLAAGTGEIVGAN